MTRNPDQKIKLWEFEAGAPQKKGGEGAHPYILKLPYRTTT